MTAIAVVGASGATHHNWVSLRSPRHLERAQLVQFVKSARQRAALGVLITAQRSTVNARRASAAHSQQPRRGGQLPSVRSTSDQAPSPDYNCQVRHEDISNFKDGRYRLATSKVNPFGVGENIMTNHGLRPWLMESQPLRGWKAIHDSKLYLAC